MSKISEVSATQLHCKVIFLYKLVKYWSQISRRHCLIDWYWLCMSLKPSTVVSESMRVLYSMKRASTKVPKTRPWSSGMWLQSWPLSRGHIITCLRVICASVIHVAKYLRQRQTSGVHKGEGLQEVSSTQFQKVPIYLLNCCLTVEVWRLFTREKLTQYTKKCIFEKPNSYLPTVR